MTEDFKRIIDEDIVACEIELKSGSKQSRNVLYTMLISKYGNIIDGFENNLKSLFYDDSGSYVQQNIEIMRQKLVLFKAMEYQNVYAESDSGITFNNTNQMTTTVNITFSEAKKQIENMTCLRDEEIEEIHSRIDELEAIINSSDRKTKKWDKAKEIIKWVTDKGIDVGLTLIPLVLKLGE